MRIAEALARTSPSYSFEVYAPYAEDGVLPLLETIRELRRLDPLFVSVTCTAGARRKRRTLEMVTRIKGELGIEPLAHLTCLGASGDDLHAQLQALAAAGVENVLALRGDPPRREPPAGGFSHAAELAAFIVRYYDFCLAGACYPQGHPESATLAEDLNHLVRKVEAGVEVLITQAFFENAHYFAFVERARAAGIRVPILAGIMPVTDLGMLERMSALDPRTTAPAALRREIEHRADDPDAVLELGIAYATLQCEELLRGGAPGIHFYTRNAAPATSAVLAALRLHQPGREHGPIPGRAPG